MRSCRAMVDSLDAHLYSLRNTKEIQSVNCLDATPYDGLSPAGRRRGRRKRGFNPHPAARPGASRRRSCRRHWFRRFNPHPAARPGASNPAGETSIQHGSFNPHPAARPGASPTSGGVPRRSCFNPHPAARPGASSSPTSSAPMASGFNPHPAARPGASAQHRHVSSIHPVSILTRPQGRALPSRLHAQGKR